MDLQIVCTSASWYTLEATSRYEFAPDGLSGVVVRFPEMSGARVKRLVRQVGRSAPAPVDEYMRGISQAVTTYNFGASITLYDTVKLDRPKEHIPMLSIKRPPP